MYLTITHASGYIEEKGVNKYLVFNSADENKELLKNTMMFLIELEAKSKKISGDERDYEKDSMKINFYSDDDLQLNKQLKFHNMVITIRSVFEKKVNFIRKYF